MTDGEEGPTHLAQKLLEGGVDALLPGLERLGLGLHGHHLVARLRGDEADAVTHQAQAHHAHLRRDGRWMDPKTHPECVYECVF